MIFVTVGTQMGFDRLIRAVDEWASHRDRSDVFAQIGPRSWRPRHIDWVALLEPPQYRAKVEEASLVVAHAGMGSILTAREFDTPILVMPRRGYLGEHVNDHQMATARYLPRLKGVWVALDECELIGRLSGEQLVSDGTRIGEQCDSHLVQSLRQFIMEG